MVVAFNPYYRVLLATCRLEKADKPGSNATVKLHFYAYIDKKGIQVLWSGSTWAALMSVLVECWGETLHIFITYCIAGSFTDHGVISGGRFVLGVGKKNQPSIALQYFAWRHWINSWKYQSFIIYIINFANTCFYTTFGKRLIKSITFSVY